MKRLLVFALGLLAGSTMLAFAADNAVRTFHGEVADSQCSMNVHSLTRSHEEMLKSKSMGGNGASCTLYCIRYMGGEFVLAMKNDVLYLDSPSVQNFAGEKVKVTGTFDAKTKTIHALKIEAEQ